jgi:hypothetical protein
MVSGFDADEYGQAEPQLVSIQKRNPSLNHALGLKTLDPFPTGCRRQSDPVADVCDRQCAIVLKNI